MFEEDPIPVSRVFWQIPRRRFVGASGLLFGRIGTPLCFGRKDFLTGTPDSSHRRVQPALPLTDDRSYSQNNCRASAVWIVF